jgi:hypothetical protein
LPGGNGILLDSCHPRHLDYVAGKNPNLKLLLRDQVGHGKQKLWPFCFIKEIFIMNCMADRSKYFTPDLKHDIARRLKDRILFGGDYPLYTYERLVSEWKDEGYKPEILQKVFLENAKEFLKGFNIR